MMRESYTAELILKDMLDFKSVTPKTISSWNTRKLSGITKT